MTCINCDLRGISKVSESCSHYLTLFNFYFYYTPKAPLIKKIQTWYNKGMNNLTKQFKSDWISLIILAVFFGGLIWIFPQLPVLVPSHYNVAGQVDGYLQKSTLAWLYPVFLIAIYLIFSLIPAFDPKKENYQLFWGSYLATKQSILLAIGLLIFSTLTNGAGLTHLPIEIVAPVIVGALFFAMGFFIKKAKQNWFFGLRTPWTLSSEEVWDKTHEFGGKIMSLGGLLIMAGTVFGPSISFWFFMVSIIFIVLLPLIYSYKLYKALHG